jgi:hypothetical protein
LSFPRPTSSRSTRSGEAAWRTHSAQPLSHAGRGIPMLAAGVLVLRTNCSGQSAGALGANARPVSAAPAIPRCQRARRHVAAGWSLAARAFGARGTGGRPRARRSLSWSGGHAAGLADYGFGGRPDPECALDVPELALDGLSGDLQGLCDLAVRHRPQSDSDRDGGHPSRLRRRQLSGLARLGNRRSPKGRTRRRTGCWSRGTPSRWIRLVRNHCLPSPRSREAFQWPYSARRR